MMQLSPPRPDLFETIGDFDLSELLHGRDAVSENRVIRRISKKSFFDAHHWHSGGFLGDLDFYVGHVCLVTPSFLTAPETLRK